MLTFSLQAPHLLRYFDLCWLRSRTADLVYFREFYFKKLLTFENLIGTICTQKKILMHSRIKRCSSEDVRF